MMLYNIVTFSLKQQNDSVLITSLLILIENVNDVMSC